METGLMKMPLISWPMVGNLYFLTNLLANTNIYNPKKIIHVIGRSVIDEFFLLGVGSANSAPRPRVLFRDGPDELPNVL
jgi:hypothetical protein